MSSHLSIHYPLLITAIAFSALSASPGRAELYMADGVTLTDGWFDTNKAYAPPVFVKENTTSEGTFYDMDTERISGYFPNPDTMLCWAAQCSNILTYMEYQAHGSISYSSTYNTYSGGSDIDKIIRHISQYQAYERFTTNFTDSPCNSHIGMQWFTVGLNEGDMYYEILKDNAYKGGYLREQIGTTVEDFKTKVVSQFYSFMGDTSDKTDVLHKIVSGEIKYEDIFHQAIMDGPMTLDILMKNADGSWAKIGHALTCWGFETDENDLLSSIYITDSDDGNVELIKIPVIYNAEDGSLKLNGNSTFLTCYDENNNEKKSESSIYTAASNFHIFALGTFNNVYLIPEPATASLSLIGLSTLLMRRRRS